MGLLNKRALIRQLQKAGVASRAELARALGMSQPTAGKIVDELLADKVLEEVDAVVADGGAAQLGRPGRQLQLNRSQPSFLGIQLGILETQLVELPLGATDENVRRISFEIPYISQKPAAICLIRFHRQSLDRRRACVNESKRTGNFQLRAGSCSVDKVMLSPWDSQGIIHAAKFLPLIDRPFMREAVCVFPDFI